MPYVETLEESIVVFPNKAFPTMTDEPHFEDINLIHQFINNNAISIHAYDDGARPTLQGQSRSFLKEHCHERPTPSLNSI
jgi:hypothetical protein